MATEDFEEGSCPTALKSYAVQCGTVTVPEEEGSERTMQIAIARVFSNAAEVRDDPVVYLDGGPGADSLRALRGLVGAFEPLLDSRDLIFVDQRGIGRSRPLLECNDPGETLEEVLGACFERLSEITNLSATNSASNASDFDRVRAALGYEKWNLLGISYGTRLGLTILRDHPGGVRSAILDSVVPLEVDLIGGLGKNGQHAFEYAFAACQADPTCAEKYPDSMTQLLDVARRLDETPAQVGSAPLTGSAFVNLLFNLMYSPSGLRYLPSIIDQASRDDFSLFKGLRPSSGGGISSGMHLSLHCAEEIPFTDRETVSQTDEEVAEELRPGLTGLGYFDSCEQWPVTPRGSVENEPVVSPLPALVLSGSFDPITPPRYAELVHESLPNSQYFEIQNESHGASIGECGMKLVQAFLDAPEEEVPVACLGDLPPIEFQSRGESKARRRTVQGSLRFADEAPGPEEVARLLEELELRRR